MDRQARPAENWLDRLADGGRLLLPMTSDQGFGAALPERMASAGAIFLIERRGHDYFAAWISPVAIFPCAGSRDPVSERALADAFTKGGWQQVTRLRRATAGLLNHLRSRRAYGDYLSRDRTPSSTSLTASEKRFLCPSIRTRSGSVGSGVACGMPCSSRLGTAHPVAPLDRFVA
jgi:hypothetical protein